MGQCLEVVYFKISGPANNYRYSKLQFQVLSLSTLIFSFPTGLWSYDHTKHIYYKSFAQNIQTKIFLPNKRNYIGYENTRFAHIVAHLVSY